ncbi:MAG: transcriptional regulator TetR family [Herbinix sp.]|jgi:AcrR family transcriptional regulator|nr:transcriptional regulator TetR family [Herbinix sp.]
MEDILHRKDRLIITTIDIIDQLGIQNLSTREIARREGISEATLFRHFKSKNDLLSAVLDYFSHFDEELFQSAKLKQLKPIDSIIYMITFYSEYCENYPGMTSIMQLNDVLRWESNLTDKVKSILEYRDNLVKQLIEEAQTSGDINSDLDSGNIAHIINGAFRELCLKWRVNDRNFSLKIKTQEIIAIILNSLKCYTKDRRVNK